MQAFDGLWIWRDPALAGPLAWYREVAANRKPANFLIARTVPVAIELGETSEAGLWRELDRLTVVFLARLAAIREGMAALGSPAPGASLLDLCRELTRRMLAHCNFCAWNCAVDRRRGTKLGTCKLAAEARVSTYFHHLGEELVYRGLSGSGTIFFTSCNMRCAFCQNGDISTDKDNGAPVDARTLASMAWLLRREGCHNINWVGGEVTIHLHRIVEAVALLGGGFSPSREDLARALPAKNDSLRRFPEIEEAGSHEGHFNAPMLWNSNFLMSPESMRILRLLIDVWLPDFKFGPGRCALTVARTARYWQTATANLALLANWREDFTIRHLVMPNHLECCTYPVLDWIGANLGEAPVNIMDQFHPDTFTDPASPRYRARFADLSRRLSPTELHDAFQRARSLGLNFEAITLEKG